jgi:hypothetical protein
VASEVATPVPIIVTATPEPGYGARVPRPEPEPPLPSRRRAIFFDVENTSHAPTIERVLDHLAIDRQERRTDFVAVGNWRVIGHEVGRLLARHGAQLVHSAPSTGVRDWSDLRIAVSAGVWLAGARPGDVIEIVSEDRAFDAVGDVAAALGIEFHRLSYRGLTATAPAARPETAGAASARGRGRRRRRRGPAAAQAPHAPAAGRAHHAPAHGPAHPAPQPPAPAPGHEEPHTAPHDEIIHVVQDLMHRAHGRPVLIDRLARELKERGFSRTPGSPRLVTRLRRIKELSVSPTGMISLVGGVPAAEHHARHAPAHPSPGPHVQQEAAIASGPDIETASEEPAPSGEAVEAEVTQPARPSARRGSRRRRRGGRRPAA